MTDGDAAVTSMAGALGRDLRTALAEVALARERPYYDAEADRAASEADDAKVSLDRLGDLVASTHTTRPGYKPAIELYPWVDLQPDGKLRSLYTAQVFEPEDLIRADFEVLQGRVSRLMQATRLEGGEQARIEAEVEAALPFNCEHVVPQSWFAKAEPMRGDLHHLFACESRCNSFRGNTPVAEFPDFPPRSQRPAASAPGTLSVVTAARASPADSNPPTARARQPAQPATSGFDTPH